jgi:hypothetical protein
MSAFGAEQTLTGACYDLLRNYNFLSSWSARKFAQGALRNEGRCAHKDHYGMKLGGERILKKAVQSDTGGCVNVGRELRRILGRDGAVEERKERGNETTGDNAKRQILRQR